MSPVVPSPAPGAPQTPTKAYVAALLAFLTSFALYYVADTGAFTVKEIVQGLVLALIASGITGVPTYVVRNKPLR